MRTKELKTVKADLSDKFDEIDVMAISDLHIGDANCNIKFIDKVLEQVRDTENMFCVLNGDLINNATRDSVSDVYTEKLTPQQQKSLLYEKLLPIKDKILAVTSGNHENRTWKKSGVDILYDVCEKLGIEDRYCAEGCVLFVRFGKVIGNKKQSNGSGKVRKLCYSFYITHMSMGGRKSGSKLNAVKSLKEIIDVDIYVGGHVHEVMGDKDRFFRADPRNNTITSVTKGYMIAGSALNYGGYGQSHMYSPSELGYPIARLKSKVKTFNIIV